MTRKILLDGNPDDRPSLPFAIYLCLIPITTFFYMKRRQRNRYNQVPSSTGQQAPPRSSRTGESGGDQNKEKHQKAKHKMRWEERIAAEKKKIEEEKKKTVKAQHEAAALKRQLQDAQQSIKEGRYKHDLAMHPNDPFLDDQTPDEVFNRVKPLNRNPAPPAKPSVRNGPLSGQDPGNPLHPKKGVGFKESNDEYKHPVDRIATMRKDGGPGISEHDVSLHVPRYLNEAAWSNHMEDKLEAKGYHLCNYRYQGPEQLQKKTDELKKHLFEATFAIFQNAAKIAFSQKGSAEYEEAMIDACNDDHGVYPGFASAPIRAIVELITEDDTKAVLFGMKTMKTKIDRGDKDPDEFIARYCLLGIPDKNTMTLLWYLDSFRVVSSLRRMNIIRGEPVYLERKLGLKFILFEWLEIFGIQCAQQRLLSRAGFDLAGLCIRLYCLPAEKKPNELKLIITIFLPGGANRVSKNGKAMENWGTRMQLAVSSWREVWGFLSMQTGAEGRSWGYDGFAERELVFSPGFTFEGIKQAGGLPSEASPNAGPNNRYDPILNAWTPPNYPYPGHGMLQFGQTLIPMIRPTCISFVRRRQLTWAHTSLTEKSHDFEDGMVALCLDMLDPRPWVQGLVHKFPDEVTDDDLEVRLQNDDVKTIKLNSTIPMTMGANNKPIGFPDVTVHPKLDEIYLTYVSITRHADGTPSAEAPMPATATLVLASEFGLRFLLHRDEIPGKAKRVKLYVDIRSGDVQKFADELFEVLVGLGRRRFGASWEPHIDRIHQDLKEDVGVLKQVYYQLEDHSKFPVSQKISRIAW